MQKFNINTQGSLWFHHLHTK